MPVLEEIEEEGTDNTSTEVAIGEAAQGLVGEERKDVLGPLPMFHQYDQ